MKAAAEARARPTTTAAGGGLLLRLLLLLLSAATDVVRATEVYAPDCQATPDGYSSRVGTGCTQYVYCQGGVVTSTYNCPVGTIYNGKVCDWAANVRCAPNIPLLVDDERFFLPETTTVTPEFSIATATTTAQDSSSGAGFLCGNSLTELETTCGTAKNCFSDPCPPEAPFCFPFQCKTTSDASTAATMPTTAARFLCANSLAELKLSCGTAKDCFNDPCPSEAPFCFPFQCTTTSYASTAATMTTTTAATTTAATTTTDATTTTETSRTAATTTADATTTDTTTTDSTTTTDTTTTETSTTAATTTTDATTTDATTTDATTETTTTDATTTNATTTDTTTTETSTSVADTTTTDTTTTETTTTDATTTTDTTTTETSTTAATTTADATTTDTTTTEASTTAATKPPTYFYPQTFEGNTFCFSGIKTSIAALAKMTPDEQEAFLSLTMCECCSKHKCAMGSGMCPTIGPTTFVTTTTDATTTVVSTTDASTTAATTPADATTTDASTTAATTTADATTADATTTNTTTTNTTTTDASTTAATTTANATTTDASTTAATTTTDATTTNTTTTAARDAECQTEPFSVKVGTGCREFFYCEGGRIIQTKACPAGMRFNGRHCDSAANVDCEPDPDCREQPNFFSAKVSTGCRDYVFCENGLLVETVTCPDGLLFNGMYCDLAMNVNCTFDSPSLGISGARTRRLRGSIPANPDKM